MDSINFKDFMIKLALSGSVEYFPDNNKEENKTESTGCKKCEKYLEKFARTDRDALKKHCTESLKAEKKCECKCKSNQDFHKELLEEISDFHGHLVNKYQSINEITSFLCDIENKLMARLSMTEPIYWIMCKDDDESFIINLLQRCKLKIYDDGFKANEKADTVKSCQCAEKCLTDDEINEALENWNRSDKIIYLPKTEKEKIIKLINKCFEIIDKQSDVDFIRIKEHLLDVLLVLAQYK